MKDRPKLSEITSRIVSTNDLKGDTITEMYEDLYEKIGNYFLENAKRMSSDMCYNNRSLTITIDIEPNCIITIDRKTSEYLMEVK